MGSSPDFDSFVGEFFSAEFRWNAARATSAGLHDYDAHLGERSEAAHLARLDEIRSLLDRTETLGKAWLSRPDRIDLEIIRGHLRAEELDLDTLETWRHNPISYLWYTGAALDTLTRRQFAPPRRRLAALTARLRMFPEIMRSMEANVRNPAREFTETALGLAVGSTGFVDAGLEAWALGAAEGDAALIKEFRSAHSPAVAALEEAIRWLGELRSRSDGSFPIGRDALAALLRHQEMVATSLDDLLETAGHNLERDYRDFVRTAEEIDPGRTPNEVMKHVSDDRPGETELLESTWSTIGRIRGFLESNSLVTLPAVPPPQVVETPEWYRFGVFAAMDSPGPYERVGRDAFYYVTPPEAAWTPSHKEEHLRLFNRPVMDLITIHEAYPGHFLQFANAARFPTHTRRLLSCGSNVEGWAHYAEQMMVEEGYGSGDPKIRLAQLQEALVRDCRFVAAIGLHSGSLSLGEAAALFETRAFMERANALEEARRGTFDPTYLVYTLGKLQIYKLRDDWEDENGGRDLRRFHDAFLLEGGAPLAIVRQRMLETSEDAILYPAAFYESGTHRH